MLNVDGGLVIRFVDAAYETQEDYVAWAERLLGVAIAITGVRTAVLHRMGSTYGPDGAFYLTRATDFVIVGPNTNFGATTPEAVIHQPCAEQSCGSTCGSTLSQTTGLGERLASAPGFRDCWREPVVDVAGLVSREASGDIICVGCGLERTAVPSPREKRLLMRLATHLGAADRLRRSPSPAPLDEAEAILSPEGKVLEARKAAKTHVEALDEGRCRRDEARRTRHDPEKALEIWRGLVAGRWSLVDHFDTDGKRFVLAMKNTPRVKPRKDLTPRERRVAALAAMGHRDKEIAYMLGLSLGSVVAALHRARRKLGAASRTELAIRWRRGT